MPQGSRARRPEPLRFSRCMVLRAGFMSTSAARTEATGSKAPRGFPANLVQKAKAPPRAAPGAIMEAATACLAARAAVALRAVLQAAAQTAALSACTTSGQNPFRPPRWSSCRMGGFEGCRGQAEVATPARPAATAATGAVHAVEVVQDPPAVQAVPKSLELLDSTDLQATCSSRISTLNCSLTPRDGSI